MDNRVAKALRGFVKAVNANLATGKASERSHYTALEGLLEACGDGIDAQLETAGARDIVDITVKRGANYIGAVEVKDPTADLGAIEADAAAGKTDHNATQFRTYIQAHDNLIYTNLLEWRRYRKNGAPPVQTAVLGHVADAKVHLNAAGIAAFESLISGFLASHPQPQNTARDLAREMARLTGILRDQTVAAYAANDPFLHGLYDAFQEELIHGLEADEFADMYAQTIAYGLFTARILHAGDDKAQDEFDRFAASRLVPRTNPFLRRVFGSLIAEDDMPPTLNWIVDDLTALIKAADVDAIQQELARYGASRAAKDAVVEHDAVIYFYEHFLRAYDPAKAKKRGVYYTPLPVVSYIVRSIDILLQTEFDKPLGLADPGVIILDPACGTGTFLYEVIRVIYERLGARSQADWVNKDVPALLNRLFGFELLMAPYTIAHLKLAEILRETGYDFEGEQRLKVYLTNTLEEAEQRAEGQQKLGIAQAISKEREGADNVKEKEKVMVVLGNPPYAGLSANMNSWIDDLLKEGYPLPDGNRRGGYYTIDGAPLGERKVWLQDDYVKFLRWAQWRIDKTGHGIVGMITNHGYLDNPTFRGMRQNLMATFDQLSFLDLHGNANKKEKAPDGSKDENVFDIMQGVAVALMVKGKNQNVVNHADLYGLRADKYAVLNSNDIGTTEWREINPNAPFYFFVEREEKGRTEYEEFPPISEILGINVTGIVTARDGFVIGFDDREIETRINTFLDSKLSDDEVKNILGISENYAWRVRAAREQLGRIRDRSGNYENILYRPFDVRRIIFDSSVVWRTRINVMRHMLAGENLGLCSNREVNAAFKHAFCTKALINDCAVSAATRERTYLFPLYLYGAEGTTAAGERRPNLAAAFVSRFVAAVGATELVNSPTVGQRAPAGAQGRTPLHPEDIFYYIYGVLHAPTYRSRYAEFLKMDFPRVPLPKDYDGFDALAAAGEKLARLHLLKDKERWDWRAIGQRGQATDTTVGKVDYDDSSREIIFDAKKPRAEQLRVGPVPANIWEFHVGGYQVLQKWLKDRKGRKVDLGDYVPIIVALMETDRIMKEECDPAFKAMLGL